LLKAVGQEELAALLNNMPQDDRPLLLGELPANMIRQLLTHLSPEERTVAVTLLGYPEHSIGRS
jgi:magnesium transporter